MTEEKKAMESAGGLKEELEAKLGADALAEKLESKLAEYHRLITKDAALHLVGLEVLGARVRAATILQARGTQSQCKLRARVERVFPARVFDGGGKSGMTQRVAVSDHSASCTIVCYDDACKMLNEVVMAGDIVEIEPLRFRSDEFHLSQGGKITLVQKGMRAKLSGSEGIGNFEGTVAEFLGDHNYRKGGRAIQNTAETAPQSGTALMSSFSISDGSASARVVLWDSTGLAGRLLEGAHVGIENGMRRGGEIHIGYAGRLVFEPAKAADDDAPEIANIDIDGAGGEVRVICKESGRVLKFTLDEACAHFGIGAVPDGISPLTALTLKKADWIGKKVPRRWIGTGKANAQK